MDKKKKDKSISIRFIANDETIEDLTEKTTTANDEENNWTKEFLQAGSTIFGSSGRKRSGSMDSSASSTSEPNQSIGTWKLIKGKVVQAVEDIKRDKDGKKEPSQTCSDVEIDDFADILSNKSDLGQETPTGGIDSGDETDSETTSLTKLIDKFQQKRSKRTPSGTPDKKPSIISRLGRNIGNDDNTDKTTTSERKLSSSPSSSLLSKFGTRKSKTIDAGDEGGESTILTAFLKSRKKEVATDKTPPPKKRSVEVEDGVEIFEDMAISCTTIEDATINSSNQPNQLQLDLQQPPMPVKSVDHPFVPAAVPLTAPSSSVSSILKNMVFDNQLRLSAVVIGIFSILYFEIPPFLLGFLTCLLLVYCSHKVYSWALEACNPESGQIQMIDKAVCEIANVCEIQPVIEHKSLRSYSGWMYETVNYDPNNMTFMRNAVFIKLDGSLLRISTASSRIKRSMLYKDAIDTSTIDFIQHKFYNLEDAKIEMSPKHLARKRYFSRKYPILLIVARTPNSEPRCWMDSKQKSEEDSQSTPTKSSEERRFDRIYLFAVRDREKEDWFRRFIEASSGHNCDSEFPPEFLTLLGRKRASPENSVVDQEPPTDLKGYLETEFPKLDEKGGKEDEEHDFTVLDKITLNETSDSFHIRASASRLTADFLNFIGSYQHANTKYLASACSKASPSSSAASSPSHFQFVRTLDGRSNAASSSPPASPSRSYSFLQNLQLSRTRPDKKSEQDDVAEKLLDDSEVGPELVQGFSITINVGWANILLGRVVYGCVHDPKIIENIREFMQKKLSVLKLPSFMEEVNVAEIQLGHKPPIIQSISSPELDERGLWIDFDLTYEGLVEVTITTNLNLMRLKRQQMPTDTSSQNLTAPQPVNPPASASASPSNNQRSSAVLYDSDAESSGSSSESESTSINSQLYMSYDVANASPANPEGGTVVLNRIVTDDKMAGGSGGSKRFLRIVDRIAASNIFQSATELSYVQNAFKNMNTKIQLKLQLKSLIGRLVANIPPTPSDRLWIAFRAPPKIELSAKPTLGSNVVDWTLVTNLIENKLYEEVCKYLVFPNMVDIIMPVLGESTYKEKNE